MKSPERGHKLGELANHLIPSQSFEHLGEALLQDYIYYRDLLQGDGLLSFTEIGF